MVTTSTTTTFPQCTFIVQMMKGVVSQSAKVAEQFVMFSKGAHGP